MSSNISDVIVIGAGPAGISCVETLIDNNYTGNIKLIECGRNYLDRACLADKMLDCEGCNGKCNVISGFGGSIHYGDSVKLSKFPSGKRLIQLIGNEQATKLINTATELFNVDDSQFVENDVIAPFTVKKYPVSVINSSDVKSYIEAKYNKIISATNIEYEAMTEVININRNCDVYEVITKSNIGIKCYKSKNIVVAAGRKGLLWWRNQLRVLGLSFKAPTASIGLRFECPKEYLVSAGRLHPDFKTTINACGIKVKTFCFCAGEGGGRIKYTNYGKFTLLDGHVIPEYDCSKDVANFALVAQLKDINGYPSSFEWIYNNIILKYTKLNKVHPGKPILQWYPDFKNKTITCDTIEKYIDIVGFNPSISDFDINNISQIIPDNYHTALCDVCETLMRWFFLNCKSQNSAHDYQEWLSRVGVIGLELEGLWDQVDLMPDMQASLSNLYVIGDCTGIAQGILQSSVTGIIAANAISKKQ